MMLQTKHKRLISGFMAAVMAILSGNPLINGMFPEKEDNSAELIYRSIALHPNGDESDRVVTLDGMMPKGAEAVVADVSDDYGGVVAYDISISSKAGDYQPGRENPILVKIVDPAIPENLELWHISDDGSCEQILEYTAEESQVSFYAAGFSVYEIVEVPTYSGSYGVQSVIGNTDCSIYEIEPVGEGTSYTYPVEPHTYDSILGTATEITSLETLKQKIADGEAFYFSGNRFHLFLKDNAVTIKNGRPGIGVTSAYNSADINQNLFNAVSEGAVQYYFEEADAENNQYYIYTLEDENDPTSKLYINYAGTDGLKLSSDRTTVWGVSFGNNCFRFKRIASGRYMTEKGDTSVKGFAVANSNALSDGEHFKVWQYDPPALTEDPYHLDGNSYALINMKDDATGNAMLAGYSPAANTLGNLAVTRVDDGAGNVSYTSPYGLSGWLFEWIPGTMTYKVSALADDGAARKYLKLDANGLYLVDEAEASALRAVPNDSGRIRLCLDGNAISRGNSNFGRAADSANNSALYFDLASLPADTDSLQLDGKTVGLMGNAGNGQGYAMLALPDPANAAHLESQAVTAEDGSYIFFGDISGWTFHQVDTNRYTISTETDEGTKYLRLVQSSVTLSDMPYILTVDSGTGGNAGKIRILDLASPSQVSRNAATSFFFINNITSTDSARWLDTVTIPEMPDSDPFGLDGNTYGIAGVNQNRFYAMGQETDGGKLNSKQMTYNAETGEYEVTKSIASGWTFHWVDQTTYTLSDSMGKYLKLTANEVFLTDEADASLLTLIPGSGDFAGKFRLVDYDVNRALTCLNTFQSKEDNATGSTKYFNLLQLNDTDDPYALGGKEYGLMSYHDGSSIGNSLSGNNDGTCSTRLTQVITRNEINPADTRIVYVPSDSDATLWQITCVKQDIYTLSATINGTTQYISSDGSSLSLTDTPSASASFRIIPDSSSKTVTIADENGKFISFDGSAFSISESPVALHLLDKTTIESDEQMTYSANRISVSDGERAHDGQQVIVYTRIWDDTNKRYDFFAINYDGSLYPCYPYGDKLMWVGDAMNTLLWNLTVYHDEDGAETGYYELQNVYSGQYIAPQRNGQLLSDRKIGIQLPKRKYEYDPDTNTYSYGEYFTSIMAWDDPYYDYAALKGVITDFSTKEGSVVPVAYSQADDFYFAVPDEMNSETEDVLHQVETLSNSDYGITLRMVDFLPNNIDGAGNSSITKDYFNNNYDNTKGLLETGLDEDGHPHVARTGVDFGDAFNDAVYADHLFIQSIHDSSGYFEFDSCQNFATLRPNGSEPVQQTDSNGNPLYLDADGKCTTVAEGNSPIYDFTVYRELGTIEASGNTRLHGQFLPYNYIIPDTFSRGNPQNLYDALARPLDDDDPRKYEHLYTVVHSGLRFPDYYFGMEMEAKFVQTPSGLDAWGHDVIFEFTGDDDFWLFVDGELVLDLGGVHSAEAGKVNFRTGKVVYNGTETTLREIFKSHYLSRGDSEAEAEEKLDEIFEDNGETGENQGFVFTDYTEHTMKIYYMERGAGASNLHMRFNLSAVTPGNVLFAKRMSGSKEADVDYSMIQFPFQIQYKQQLSDAEWTNLTNIPDSHHKTTVSYQNSTQTVHYASQYQPPNSTKVYNNVFFLVPNRSVEINFPDEAMYYRIIECGVDKDIYTVSSNAEEALQEVDPSTEGDGHIVTSGNVRDMITQYAQVSEQPSISFDNAINADNIRSLNITKKLYTDKSKETELTAEDDPTTFNYRLYLSNGTSGKLELANMVKYYVLDPEYHVCSWDADEAKFVTVMPHLTVAGLESLTAEEKEVYAFHSSRYGSISHIPAGYTVRVPGLPTGTKFLVQERENEIPVGYELLNFERKTGQFTDDSMAASGMPSYKVDETYVIGDETFTVDQSSKLYNSAGTIVSGYQAEVVVNNYPGYGLKAEKQWSDVDFVQSHGDIYTAVYVDGVLLEGTVRRIKHPDNSVTYFFEDLLTGKTLDDYKICEVTLDNPTVDEDGVVTAYTAGSLRKIEAGGRLSLSVLEKGSDEPVIDEYSVNYAKANDKEAQEIEKNGKGRKDIIRNNRKGGIQINLHVWNNTTAPDQPLAGGTFKLYRNGTEVETYESDEFGNVTVLYGVHEGQVYRLEQIASPTGYIAMEQPVTFTVTKNGTDYGITFTNPNDTAYNESDTDHTDGKYWAEYDSPAGIFGGIVDIYNKPYSLRVIKVQTDTEIPLNGAEFSLYRAVMQYGSLVKDYQPIPGYESLVTGDEVETGVIPKIDNTLIPRQYYLTEKTPPPGYEGLSDDLIITITEKGDIRIESDAQTGHLEKVDSADLSSVTYIINVPNELGEREYYFDIEKLIFVDKYVHGSDPQQKFVFRVDRFAENDTEMNAVIDSFYVTMNCKHELETYPYTGNLDAFTNHVFDSTENRVTVTYGTDQSYAFPAAIWQGRQTVKVTQKGVYRVSEISSWSSVDYDFWTGSNIYAGFEDGGEADANSVKVVVTDKNIDYYSGSTLTDRPTASFTNTETEYAYLSAQAYAENKIKRSKT